MKLGTYTLEIYKGKHSEEPITEIREFIWEEETDFEQKEFYKIILENEESGIKWSWSYLDLCKGLGEMSYLISKELEIDS